MPAQIEGYLGSFWCWDGKEVHQYYGRNYTDYDAPVEEFTELEAGIVTGITLWQPVVAPEPPSAKPEELKP